MKAPVSAGASLSLQEVTYVDCSQLSAKEHRALQTLTKAMNTKGIVRSNCPPIALVHIDALVDTGFVERTEMLRAQLLRVQHPCRGHHISPGHSVFLDEICIEDAPPTIPAAAGVGEGVSSLALDRDTFLSISGEAGAGIFTSKPSRKSSYRVVEHFNASAKCASWDAGLTVHGRKVLTKQVKDWMVDGATEEGLLSAVNAFFREVERSPTLTVDSDIWKLFVSRRSKWVALARSANAQGEDRNASWLGQHSEAIQSSYDRILGGGDEGDGEGPEGS